MQNEYYNDELYHYGRKGMKWGQHIYGKVKLAGNTVKRASKKVYDYQKARTDKKRAQEELRKAGRSKTGAKRMTEMSDDELRRAIERARLEDTYAQLRPQQVSTGKKFVNDILNKTVMPAVTEAGKQTLQNYLTKAGAQAIEKNFKVPASEMDKLKKEYDKLKIQSDIEELKLGGGKNWKNLVTKQQYEKTDADRKAAKKAQEEAAAKQKETKAEEKRMQSAAEDSKNRDKRSSDGSNPSSNPDQQDPSTKKHESDNSSKTESPIEETSKTETSTVTIWDASGRPMSTVEINKGKTFLDEILKK